MVRIASHSRAFQQGSSFCGRSGIFLAVFLFYIGTFLFAAVQPAFCSDEEEKIFNYERFVIKKDAIESIPENKRAKDEVKRFADLFEKGKNDLLNGDIEGAKTSLLEARKAWPEYFGTDLVIARAFEMSGDNFKAARYCRSYLDKLKYFHTGRYRISGAIIRFISKEKVEGYETSKKIIIEHFQRYGIDINHVRPMTADSGIVVYIVSLTFFFVLYMFLAVKVIPAVRLKLRVRKPPEGFWVCRHCGGMSPELSKVCNECRRPRS
ncbi:MAG TPA: hypothetical protein PKY78_05240 [Candidatus Omnitrophota bacterium]|nr:hypothetical protein [Candidatus Omnitrophota bacterium]HPS20374.1 hypothetical protein [Candidatus Omnitrophota bacterium]